LKSLIGFALLRKLHIKETKNKLAGGGNKSTTTKFSCYNGDFFGVHLKCCQGSESLKPLSNCPHAIFDDLSDWRVQLQTTWGQFHQQFTGSFYE